MLNELRLVKFFQIFFLIIYHILYWFFTGLDNKVIDPNGILYLFALKTLPMMLFTTTLPITSGIILYFRTKNRVIGKRLRSFPIKESLVMSGTLFIASEILMIPINILEPNGYVFFWGILKFLAVSIPIVLLIAKIHLYIIPVVALIIIIFAPEIRGLLLPWHSYYIVKILIGDVPGDFYWPMIPWISSVSIGYYIGHYFFNSSRSTNTKRALIILFTLSLIAIIFKIERQNSIEINGIYNDVFYPPTPTFIYYYLFYFSIYLFSIALSKVINLKRYGMINIFSQMILVIYVVTVLAEIPIRHINDLIGGSKVTNLLIASITLILANWALGFLISKYL